MGDRDPRIDDYIARAAPFARPILEAFRAAVHAAAPHIQESIKWGMPHFEQQGLVCGMAAFKAHCAVTFHKAPLLFDGATDEGAMGQLGRLASVDDLPPRAELERIVREAVRLNEAGVKAPRRPPKPPAPREMPDDFAEALHKSPQARAAFEAFPPGAQREYVEWIAEAKRADTRARRLAQAIEWIAEGKRRHWKYERC